MRTYVNVIIICMQLWLSVLSLLKYLSRYSHVYHFLPVSYAGSSSWRPAVGYCGRRNKRPLCWEPRADECFPLRPGVSQNLAMHASRTAGYFFFLSWYAIWLSDLLRLKAFIWSLPAKVILVLISTFPKTFTFIFSKSSPYFLTALVLATFQPVY